MENIVNIPYISIRPNYISMYSLPENCGRRSKRQQENEFNLQSNHHKGIISFKAKRRIENAIAWLLELSKEKEFYSKAHGRYFNFKVNFITLTLASEQIHTDNEIKSQCLDHFLTVMRQKFKVNNYLWRAEAQKNGNIHFHIISDKFIPYWEVRSSWNKIQNKLGYIDRFFDKHGHNDPNSTDIHSIKKVRNLPAYLAKYCTKKSVHREIQGKQWGLSYSLSRIRSAVTVATYALKDECRFLCAKFKKNLKQFDYCSVLYINSSKWSKITFGALRDVYYNYIEAYRSLAPT